MFRNLIRRANSVIEALPYLIKFNGRIIVIKYGGAAMQNEELKQSVIQDVVLLKMCGMEPILVHGGGPEINKCAAASKGIEPKFLGGYRVTDKETMKVVQKVLGEKINQQIVSLIKKAGGKAKGFYGKKGTRHQGLQVLEEGRERQQDRSRLYRPGRRDPLPVPQQVDEAGLHSGPVLDRRREKGRGLQYKCRQSGRRDRRLLKSGKVDHDDRRPRGA